MQKFKHIPGLDGVRGVAILLVMLSHGTYGYYSGGFMGVDLFFVLSGYLITSLLKLEFETFTTISYFNFYARRTLRLLPPLFIGVIIIFPLWQQLGGSPSSRFFATIASLFYFANVVPVEKIGPFGHLWSLAVEEHFYFLWPAVFACFLLRRSLRLQILSLTFAILGVVSFRAIAYVKDWHLIPGFFVINPWEFTFCRIDAILMGAMLAILLPHASQTLRSKCTGYYSAIFGLLVLIILGCLVDKGRAYMFYGGYFLVDLFCLYIVFTAVCSTKSPFTKTALCWIGRRSYGMYVYHVPVFLLLEKLRINHSLANLAVVTLLRFGITLIVADISYRFIELPILKYKWKYQAVSNAQ